MHERRAERETIASPRIYTCKFYTSRSPGEEVCESGYLDAAAEPPLCRKEKNLSTKMEKCFLPRESPYPNGLHGGVMASLSPEETPRGDLDRV